MKLESATLFSTGQYMDIIMATSTKYNAVVDFVPKLWVMFPGLYMVYRYLATGNTLMATLALHAISSNTLVTPVLVGIVISPLLVAKLTLRPGSLSSYLFCNSRLITTSSRTISATISIIRIAVKSLATPLALFINTLFAHQYEFNMEAR